MNETFWTAEKVKELKQCYDQGKKIAEIAIWIGSTYFAVAAKIQMLRKHNPNDYPIRQRDAVKKRGFWNTENTQELIKLLNTGVETKIIAQKLCATIGQITGKTQRVIHCIDRNKRTMILQQRKNYTNRKNLRIARTIADNKRKQRRGNQLDQYIRKDFLGMEALPPPDQVEGVAFIDLRLNNCRWIISDIKDDQTKFCGAEIKPQSSYCECHYDLVYMKSRDKEDEKHSKIGNKA